jgi:release factor glutamine methyltransferase
VQLKAAIVSAIARLSAENVRPPRHTAELLLMFILNRDRAYLYTYPEHELTTDESDRYERVLAQRLQGIPTQYITGHQEFWGLDFIVTPAVLIPRPETEHLIETVIELAGLLQGAPPTHPRIADVGTGSGCIAVALATEFPGSEIHATDISAPALEVAKANAARLGAVSQIQFHQTDLLAGLPEDFFDFIVSNPPYVGTSEHAQLLPEVIKFEPHAALFAGEDGMDVIRRLVPAAWHALHPGGFLVMEIGSTLSGSALDLLAAWDEPTLRRDLQSLPRVVYARKTSIH